MNKLSLENYVNCRLLVNLVKFIYESNPDKISLSPYWPYLREDLFYNLNQAPMNIQDTYDIRYLGELLERYASREINNIEDFRGLAIGFSLAKNFFTDDMFIGDQKENFIAEVLNKYNSGFDIYLAYALYHLDVDTIDKKEITNHVLSHQYQSFTDIVVALHIPKDKSEMTLVFNGLKSQISYLLTAGRNFMLSDSVELLAEFISKTTDYVKSARGKDMMFLKALCALSQKRIEAESVQYKTLCDNNFKHKEIRFLNYYLPRHLGTTDTLTKKPATYQKVACDYILSVLSSSESMTEAEKTKINSLLEKYTNFKPKFDGFDGIAEYLEAHLILSNNDTFLWLLNLNNFKFSIVYNKIFEFDILDDSKTAILERLDKDNIELLLNHLIPQLSISEADKARQYIARIKTVTGYDYIDSFKEYNRYPAFINLVDMDIIELDTDIQNVEALTKDYAKNIAGYLKNVRCKKAYGLLELFINKYGIQQYENLLHIEFHESFSVHSISYNSKYHTFSERDFLSGSEHRQLAHWLVDWLYYKKPERLIVTVQQLLINRISLKIFSETEIKDITKAIEPHCTSNDLQKLANKYYTPEELEEMKKREEERKVQDKIKEELEKKQKYTLEWKHSNNESFRSINLTLDSLSRYETQKEDIFYKLAIAKTNEILDSLEEITAEDYKELVQISVKSLDLGKISISGFVELINKGNEIF